MSIVWSFVLDLHRGVNSSTTVTKRYAVDEEVVFVRQCASKYTGQVLRVNSVVLIQQSVSQVVTNLYVSNYFDRKIDLCHVSLFVRYVIYREFT
ncbi:hypothetical protein D3C80_1516940 [compost metagenome]